MAQRRGLVFLLVTLCAALSSTDIIPLDSEQVFELENVVELHDFRQNTHKTSYKLNGNLKVRSVWNLNGDQLLNFELDALRFTSKGGQVLSNTLNTLQEPFYILLTHGIPHKFYSGALTIDERNFERSIASLFYVNVQHGTQIEEDISGKCKVTYKKYSLEKIKKIKTQCSNWAAYLHRRSVDVLDVNAKSHLEVDYELSEDQSLRSITSFERHIFKVALTENLGSWIETETTLRYIKSNTLDKSLYNTTPEQLDSNLKGSSLSAEIQNHASKKTPSLADSLKNYRKKMTAKEIGSRDYSDAFLQLLPAVKAANKKELVDALKLRANEEIIDLIVDLIGASQTNDGYDAIMTVYDFDKDEDYNPIEKYVQALAIGTRPSEYIVESLLEKLENNAVSNDKLKESILLSISSICRELYHISPDTPHTVHDKVKEYAMNNMNECSSDECKVVYIRGLQNLRHPSTLSALLQVATSDTTVASVAAMKALRSFDPNDYSESYRKLLRQVFHQRTRKFDSSARTIALDILLDTNPDEEQLTEILEILNREEESFEIRTYLLQKVRMLSNRCPKFALKVRRALANCNILQNYNVQAQKGLTTVLQRTFSTSPSFNGTLVSTQEVYKGILKRGLVEMSVSNEDHVANLFTLGIHTSGLASFAGGESDNGEPEEEEEAATAGMDIAVLGVQLRPLTFFSGQGELMGHVWSGTASDPTTAYQSTLLIHDHQRTLVLHNGASVNVEVLSANSIELFGNVQFSIWNRNAHTEINNNMGWVISGLSSVQSPFMALNHVFALRTKPHIALVADIDFYSGVKLCIQLNRVSNQVGISSDLSKLSNPNDNSNKAKPKDVRFMTPGFTMALNQKNNEMCNVIFA